MIAGRARSHLASLAPHEFGLLAVLAAAILWSTGGLFIKAVSLDAFGVTLWRSPLAALTIALLLGAKPRFDRSVPRIEWAVAIAYAVTLLTFVAATKLTTAANAIFLQYTGPLYVLIFGRFLLAERPTRVDVVALVVAFGGMALFFVGKLDPSDMGGNALALVSGAAFGAFLVLLRRPECSAETRPRAMVSGNLILFVVAAAVVIARGDWGAFTPGFQDMGALVFLGVLQIGLAYTCFTAGIARIPAVEAGLVGMLEPVLNPVWVWIFLEEAPGRWAIAGGCVIIAAVTARPFFQNRRTREAVHAPSS
ncbi:MAG: DMT family transporter [Dehalococcoidia bacterium]